MEVKVPVQVVFSWRRESGLDWRKIEGLTFALWGIMRSADKLYADGLFHAVKASYGRKRLSIQDPATRQASEP